MRHPLHCLLLAIALLACACQSDEKSEPATGEATLRFYVMNFDQTTLSQAPTRTAEATSLAHLSLGIYDATTLQPVAEAQTQNAGDQDYGTFSLTLPYGQYVLVFLGYDGSRTADMTNPKAICFTDQYVPNLFSHALNLTIDSKTEQSQTVTLSRAVACFTLACTGGIPSELAKMEFTAHGGGGTLNALTGYTDVTQERTYTFSNLSANAGKDSMNVNLYSFLPANEATMDFTVKASDAEGNLIRERTFTSVPMKINQRSRFTGAFFATDASVQAFALLLDNDVWDEQNATF